MPKSKVRKKVATATASSSTAANASASTTRVRVAGPSGPIYIGVMLGLMLLGLVWLVVYYLWGQNATGGIHFLYSLGSWNFLIGFALMIAGLLMTMRWR